MCDEKFNYVAGVEREERTSKAFPRFFGMARSYLVDNSQIIHIDEDVIFGGGLIGHFGHFMLESISSRLWYVIEHPEDKRKIAFVSIKEKFD